RDSAHICTAPGTLVVPKLDLGPDTKWSQITTFNSFGAPPSGCEGIFLAQNDIGVVNNPTAGTDFANTTLSRTIVGAGFNEIVARIQNSKPYDAGNANDVKGNFVARYRFADWGSVPFSGGWGTSDIGQFNAMRGSTDGICAAGGTTPTCVGSVCGGGHGPTRDQINDPAKKIYGTSSCNIALHFTFPDGEHTPVYG